MASGPRARPPLPGFAATRRYDRGITTETHDPGAAPGGNPLLQDAAVEHTSLGDRMQFLDALRGFAVMCVVVQHSLESLYSPWAKFSLDRFRLGEFGVILFFLCSGFIIPASIERQGSQSKFWIGRFFRLFPLYWFVLALVLVLHYGFDRYPLPAEYLEHPIRATAANLTMLQNFLGAPLAIGQSWSLAYELVFYGLVSAMFVVGLHRRSVMWSSGAFVFAMVVNTRHIPTKALDQWGTRVAVVTVVALVVVLAYVWRVTRGVGPQRWLSLIISAATVLLLLNRPETMSTAALFMGTLFFGTCLYRWTTGDLDGGRLALLTALALVAGVVVWVTADIYWGLPEQVTVRAFRGAEIATFVAAYTVFLVTLQFRTRSFPKVLLWLGSISYSLYLLHAIPIYAVGPLDSLFGHWNVAATVFGSWDTRPLDAVMWIAVAVAMSALTYRWIEQPAIRVGRRLSGRAGPRPPKSSDSTVTPAG